MAIAVDPKFVHRYILKEDRDKPEGERTVFPIRAQTDRIEREASMLAAERRFWDSGMCILRACLDPWENFKRADGSDVPWETDSNNGKPTAATICRISERNRAELLDAIQALGNAKLSETDLGN
mgnify:FL=1